MEISVSTSSKNTGANNNRRKMEGKYLRQVSANVLTNAKDDMRRRSVKSHTVLQILAERGTQSSASSSHSTTFASLETSAATSIVESHNTPNLLTVLHTKVAEVKHIKGC